MSAEENLEEQSDEVAALESMYPEDFTLINPVPEEPPASSSTLPSFSLSLFPTEPFEDEVNHIACTLVISYPSTYPYSGGVPEVSVEPLEKLTEEQQGVVAGLAQEEFAQNEGNPGSVFLAVDRVKEWLAENNEDPGDGSAFSEMKKKEREREKQQQKQAEEERKRAEAQNSHLTKAEAEAERRKREGTMCTDKTFRAWNAAFMAEVEARQGGKVGQVVSHKVGGDSDPEAFVTGKMWFERKILQGSSMAMTLDVQEEGDEELQDGEVGGGVGKAKAPDGGAGKPAAVDVNEALFLDAGDDDLDLGEFSD